MSDEQFMGLAIEKARDGMRLGQTPFGAAIARGAGLIACTHNNVWATTDPTAHAEVSAIREACAALNTIDMSGCVIYSTCEPCPMCFAACHWARLDRIVFAAEIADAQRAGFNELTVSNEELRRIGGSRIELVGGVLRNEARELFKEFQQSLTSRTY